MIFAFDLLVFESYPGSSIVLRSSEKTQNKAVFIVAVNRNKVCLVAPTSAADERGIPEHGIILCVVKPIFIVFERLNGSSYSGDSGG